MWLCACAQDNQKGTSEEGRRRDEELDRQALLAEQRREEERLLQEEQQREKLERIRAVEGKMDGHEKGGVGKMRMFCGLNSISCKRKKNPSLNPQNSASEILSNV